MPNITLQNKSQSAQKVTSNCHMWLKKWPSLVWAWWFVCQYTTICCSIITCLLHIPCIVICVCSVHITQILLWEIISSSAFCILSFHLATLVEIQKSTWNVVTSIFIWISKWEKNIHLFCYQSFHKIYWRQ